MSWAPSHTDPRWELRWRGEKVEAQESLSANDCKEKTSELGNVKKSEALQKVFSLLLLKCPGYNQSYRKKLYFGSMWKGLFAFQYVQLILPIKTWNHEEEIRPLEWKTKADILQTFQIKQFLACNISVDVPIFLNDWVFKWDQSACKWGNRIKTSPTPDWTEKLSKDPFFISDFHHKRSNFQLPLLLLTAFHCACQLIAAAVFRGEKRSNKWLHLLPHLSYRMDKHFLILSYSSLQPSKSSQPKHHFWPD